MRTTYHNIYIQAQECIEECTILLIIMILYTDESPKRKNNNQDIK